MKNIVLVGFMGTGKTTVGGVLAERLNIPYINTDLLIEKKETMTINDIFSRKGEPYFREKERQIIKEVSKKENVVIDAGGGVVIDKDNVGDLKKNGIIFCLNATPEEVLKRVGKHIHRPLLNTSDQLNAVRNLLHKRKDYYKRADYQIETTGKSASEISKEIIEIYNKANR